MSQDSASKRVSGSLVTDKLSRYERRYRPNDTADHLANRHGAIYYAYGRRSRHCAECYDQCI